MLDIVGLVCILMDNRTEWEMMGPLFMWVVNESAKVKGSSKPSQPLIDRRKKNLWNEEICFLFFALFSNWYRRFEQQWKCLWRWNMKIANVFLLLFSFFHQFCIAIIIDSIGFGWKLDKEKQNVMPSAMAFRSCGNVPQPDRPLTKWNNTVLLCDIHAENG